MAEHTNRLARETSPYLLQHAHNPVDWYPWGDEAFARARQENKPIFLSIGYSTCHWCHVMERESFENDGIASVMNKDFVCIKVDREERPDIDKIYMTAVQATTGSGGWPMSAFLTPDLKPFYCGTYFPPESKYGRPGFKELLERVHDVWEANHAGILDQANKITSMLAEHSTLAVAGDVKLDDAPLRAGLEQFRGIYDTEHGGFGGAPKFPRPVVLNFLFRAGGREPARATDMALHTLRKMGEGGMFDQLGGGFHRYSVDERWLVSHFEKMLYDQAQLVSSYVDAYQITHDAFYADIARRTCDYVLRDMTDPEGGFYSAEDADSEGVEGKFYVWQKSEIANDAIRDYYGVTSDGNWEHGNNLLHVTGKSYPPDLETWRQKLLAIRSKRIRPHRDEKILTGWNGLMISAFARAAQALDEPKYRDAAQRDARFILFTRIKDGQLMRTETIPAMVEDYACFATGLLDLYETDFDPVWLKKAGELSDRMLADFYDAKAGGFFQTDGHDASVLIRSKEDYDGAEPSGNSVATLLLLRLAQMTGDEKYRQAAEKTLAAFETHLRRAPHAVPQMLCAFDFYLAKPKQIILTGPDPAMLRVIRDRYLPNKIVMIEARPQLEGKVTAYVCVNFACQLPTNDLAKFAELLKYSQ